MKIRKILTKTLASFDDGHTIVIGPIGPKQIGVEGVFTGPNRIKNARMQVAGDLLVEALIKAEKKLENLGAFSGPSADDNLWEKINTALQVADHEQEFPEETAPKSTQIKTENGSVIYV